MRRSLGRRSYRGAMSDPEDTESYNTYSVDDEDQPQGDGDSMADDRGLAEPLDEGYSPPEKWSAGQGYGNTPLEEELGETLDQRLAQEVPEPDPYARGGARGRGPGQRRGRQRGRRPASRTAGGARRGARRGRRLRDAGHDVGIDGAGASAEEAAMHEIEE